ncbi:MAG TPA: rhodanese-like domain-containing protein, partial [Methanothrix sp.]|nr:rhodanese-like domain-containing protein [Methanothrix sp.]
LSILLMALSCLLISACATDDYPDLSADNQLNTFNKQFLDGKTTASSSLKGQPWATSSLNNTNIKAQAQQMASAVPVAPVSSEGAQTTLDFMGKSDLFLKNAASNGFYVITVSEYLNSTVADNNWSVLDVGPAELYAAGHIPGSANIPLANILSQMGTIPAGKKIAVYSVMDTNAAFAVQVLRVFADREAYVLKGGADAWQAAGMTLEA